MSQIDEVAATRDKCPGCGSDMLETGSPIWETYCSNKECTYARDRMVEEVRFAHKFHLEQERLKSLAPSLLEALTNLLDHYVELVNSGEAGFWNPEMEDVVVAARAVIAKANPAEGG